MICQSCGNENPYKTRVDIADVSTQITELLRAVPLQTFHSPAVSRMLFDAEEDSRHYELEIAQLQSRVMHLRTKKRSLAKRVEKLKLLSSPHIPFAPWDFESYEKTVGVPEGTITWCRCWSTNLPCHLCSILPSVTTTSILTIILLAFKGTWPRQIFSRFFERSGCQLQTLHLIRLSVSDQDVIALLRHTPSLVELHIEEIKRNVHSRNLRYFNGTVFRFKDTVTPSFLTALHAYDHGMSSPLVPKLERLDLLVDGDLFDDGMFLEMVVSRWIPDKNYTLSVGVSSMKSVKIGVLDRTLKEDVKEQLLYLEKVGLKVIVYGRGTQEMEYSEDESEEEDEDDSEDE
ncbi:hypothetical protein D9758_003357 [Tetrapyrgos nigripes]|uniref:Uncharacterized protein n=1 Tax=Tetrapyrgos nigripes TaxID=182062 RepID=A0A8H5GVB9_9AGAR|nr:hypothetical protein D9758_003357 [Tetrapyrgos nigripes]